MIFSSTALSSLVTSQKTLILLSGLLLLAGCSNKFRKIQKNEDWRVKYEAALTYYEKKDYYRAAILFEDIRPIVRGLPEGEQVEFSLAYCQYNEGTYLLASESFKSFFEVYGRSQKAEEAFFMYAYSLYTYAPPPNLDQKPGIEAMEAMQNFLNRYPASDFSERAIDVINTSQLKLEEKGFENARQYLKVKNYKAAVIALKNFSLDFPDSKFLEESAYLRVDAQFQLANKSLPNLQEERYQAVVDLYQEFIDRYPESKYSKDAERFYIQSRSRLNQFKKNKNS
ncbi:MAG: outer membrane protein assembly factor BamD [Bacteroidetes bacterium]|nr:outer membrane protein assembly factor BamD [Bacteroidota bacterium]